MLKIESLACRRGARLVFRDAAFSLNAGGLLLITGANGSGKSSLLRVLAGLLPAAAGQMLWQGQPVAADWDAHRERLHYIGHLDSVKPELMVSEMLDYWDALRGTERAPYALDAFGLGPLLDKPIRYLSAGQKRRLTLSRLAMDDAPLWLLDEPMTALDAEGQKILQGLITRHRAKGGLAIAAMHHAMDVLDVQVLAMPEKSQ